MCCLTWFTGIHPHEGRPQNDGRESQLFTWSGGGGGPFGGCTTRRVRGLKISEADFYLGSSGQLIPQDDNSARAWARKEAQATIRLKAVPAFSHTLTQVILSIEHLRTIRALEGGLARVLPDVIYCNLTRKQKERPDQ